MRVRFRYTKLGKLRWTSHRDVARMWERAFRRISLPLAYTQGFSPRPKVSFGLALPTGAESVAEYLDVDVAGGAEVDIVTLPGRLSAALPAGIDVLVGAVLDGSPPSLQEDVISCSWTVGVGGVGTGQLEKMVSAALSARELVIPRERKGQVTDEDIRPGLLSCTVREARLECELAAKPRALRPSELVRALCGSEGEVEATDVRRTHQWIERDGVRLEPLGLPADAEDAPHAGARAS